jgi:hypothetical protein
MNPKWLFQRLLVLSEVTGCAFPQACGSECVNLLPSNCTWKIKNGRFRNAWRHELEVEVMRSRKTWKVLVRTALDRAVYGDMVAGICLLGD